MYVVIWLLLLILGLWSGDNKETIAPQPARPQIPLAPEIRRGLQAEAKAIGPAIWLYWTEEVGPISARDYGQATGFKRFNHHTAFMELRHIEFIWQPADNHYFEEFRSSYHPVGTDRQRPRWHMDYSYDGKTFFTHGTNPEEDHSLHRMTLDEEDHDEQNLTTYLNAVGLHPPIEQEELQNHQHFVPTVLALLDNNHYRLVAQDSVTLDAGHPLVRLQLEPPAGVSISDVDALDSLHLFEGPADLDCYLDPQYGYALRRLEIISAEDHKLQERIDCMDFHLHRQLYLPNDVVAAYFENGSMTQTRVWKMHLLRVNFYAPSANIFTITDKTPRTRIIDGSGENQVIHIVQKDGSLKLVHKRHPTTSAPVMGHE